MPDIPLQTGPTGPPPSDPNFGPGNTPFEALGGDTEVRALTDAFYDRMESDGPEIRALHKPDLTEARQKLYEFLSGWLGGPQLYIQKHGHPRLRQRHNPFPIDHDAAEQWLHCMRLAMDDRQIQGPLRDFLEARFNHVAHFLVNR